MTTEGQSVHNRRDEKGFSGVVRLEMAREGEEDFNRRGPESASEQSSHQGREEGERRERVRNPSNPMGRST